MSGLDIVVSGSMSDAHTWNLIYLQLRLEELGHRVLNLGSCVPADLLLEECRRHRPDLLVLSSVNGHGLADGLRTIRLLRRDGGLTRMPAVIGGKLVIDDRADGDTRRPLLDAGFDAVFLGKQDPTSFESFLSAMRPAGAVR